VNETTKPSPEHTQPESFGTTQHLPGGSSMLRRVFIGADGLRAGWSLLIFLVMVAVLMQGVTLLGKQLHMLPAKGVPIGDIAPSLALFAEALPFVMILIATWIMSKIEKRSNSVYGLTGQRVLPNLFGGLVWGVTCLSLLVFTLWKTGLFTIDRQLLFGGDVLRYAGIWLLCFFTVGLLEEYLMRGYALFTLSRGLAGIYFWLFKTRHSKALGFWTAALGLSILFGLGHSQNPGESPIGLLSAGLVGLVFSLSLWRTGSLWWAIGFHTSWDWAQSFLYGVPDSGLMIQHHLLGTHALGRPLMSGGLTGPEGSVFVLPILALVSCIVVFTLPRGSYGVPSQT
jgi:membrane protease YdiL (CAAX protease family)